MYIKVVGYGNEKQLWGVLGPWINVTNRYLGLKFLIGGTPHYGWVRITTSTTAHPLITGYAYETTPNTSIKDGTISGPEKVGVVPHQRGCLLPTRNRRAPRPARSRLGWDRHLAQRRRDGLT